MTDQPNRDRDRTLVACDYCGNGVIPSESYYNDQANYYLCDRCRAEVVNREEYYQ